MLITRSIAHDLMAELEQPVKRDGWWQVDWPDGRRTSFRSQDDALQLAREIGAVMPSRRLTL